MRSGRSLWRFVHAAWSGLAALGQCCWWSVSVTEFPAPALADETGPGDAHPERLVPPSGLSRRERAQWQALEKGWARGTGP
ncbi:DUF6059 family protein [Streptomyces sp. NPDC017529]|uniref:DUF6059 family protein n=1 Tax=Streptomyces sp. NPDC017529 TaxID=3365000 RepID=UPI003798527E